MGEESFRNMARAFVARHPPGKRSLVGYGETLPDFIDAHSGEHGLPWLADLARLDRSWLEAHLAADAQPIGADAVSQLTEADLMETRFRLHPSVRLTDTGYELSALWSMLDDGNSPTGQVNIAQRRACQLFWRPAQEVRSGPLSPPMAGFFKTLIAGQTLGQACESAIATEPGADLSAIIAFTFQSGLLTGQPAQGGHSQ